ncbi:hypothetical protein GCM10023156_03220 [Novipirellula rosea]|uniref:Uncharacterized protein n=1 Tax=Novipirellula rosea TaxID=1031540 RepID=A0ABP8M796_9BACT
MQTIRIASPPSFLPAGVATDSIIGSAIVIPAAFKKDRRAGGELDKAFMVSSFRSDEVAIELAAIQTHPIYL